MRVRMVALKNATRRSTGYYKVPAQLKGQALFLLQCGRVLERHGTDTASVCRTVFCGTCVVFKLYLPPESNEVVQPPEVPVFVVTLHPRRAVVDRCPLGQGDGLAKVY